MHLYIEKPGFVEAIAMLFMASGKLVKNYSLLIRYFEVLTQIGIDRSLSVPTSSDIEFVVNLIKEQNVSLLDALSMLMRRFIPRVNAEAARRAFEEVYGEKVDDLVAVDMVAKDLAGWTLEIAENMGLIKIDTSILR